MLLSIIVPSYNVEKYIEKCIDSLVYQENIEFEIIIVNDGSTDKTFNKICEIKNKYPKEITVVNQKNKGLGGARNTGLRHAKGKYITFVDSDDYLLKNTFSNLFKSINNKEFDILCYKHMNVFEETAITDLNQNNQYKSDIQILNNIDAQKKFFNREITSYAWDKIYRADIFRNNNIEFSEKTYYEDLRVVYDAILNSNDILVSNYCGYCYLQRDNSITKTFTKKHLDDFILEYKSLLNKIPSEIRKECAEEIKTYKISQKISIMRIAVGLNINKYSLDSELEQKASIGEILKNRYLTKNEKFIFLMGSNLRLFKLIKKVKQKLNKRY